MTFEVIGASMLAGWSSAVALIAALSGLWIVMLFALAAYYLVLRAEGIWYEAGRTHLAVAAFRARAGLMAAGASLTERAALAGRWIRTSTSRRR